MKILPHNPAKFKVGDKVTIQNFGELIRILQPLAKLVNNKSATITKFYEGSPAKVDDNDNLISLGSAHCYEVTLDQPIEFNTKIIYSIPVSESEIR